VGIFAAILICWFFFLLIMEPFDFEEFAIGTIISVAIGCALFALTCAFTTDMVNTETIVVKDYNIYKVTINNAVDSDEFYAWKDVDSSNVYKCLVVDGNNVITKDVIDSQITKIKDPAKTKYVVYDKQYKSPLMRRLFWSYEPKWSVLEIPDDYIKININFN
jgi:hypothetical protein